MKRKLLTAFALVLLGTSATFAQMGGIISTTGRDGTTPGPPSATNHQPINFSKGSKITGVGEESTSDGREAGLKLTSNALVMKKYTTVASGDDMGTHTTEVWSIPLSGAVKELMFQSNGNMAVLDTNGNVLWSTGTGGKGDILKFYPDGVLEIFDKNGMPLWKK